MLVPYLLIFLRFFAVPAALIGYVLYQAFVNKKKWIVLKTDVIYAGFFIAVYFGLYFLVS